MYRMLMLASIAFVSSENFTAQLIEITGWRLIEISFELV